MTTSAAAHSRRTRIADELIADFASAWNAHDMDALAILFHEDGTLVNAVGTYEKGREESGTRMRRFTPVSLRTRPCGPTPGRAGTDARRDRRPRLE